MDNKKEIKDFIIAYDFLHKAIITCTHLCLTFEVHPEDRLKHDEFIIAKNIIEFDLRELINNHLAQPFDTSKTKPSQFSILRKLLIGYVRAGIDAMYNETDQLEERVKEILGLNKKSKKKIVRKRT